MTLRNFLSEGGVLYNGTYDFVDKTTLTRRMKVRYGNSNLSPLFTPTDIADIVDDIFTTNSTFLRALFSGEITTKQTYSEHTSTDGLRTDDTTYNETISRDRETTTTANGTGTTIGLVNAFDNSTTPTPTDKATTENSATDVTGETVRDIHHSENNNTSEDSTSGNRGGFTKADYYDVINMQSKLYNAYDILIKLIAQEILEIVPFGFNI